MLPNYWANCKLHWKFQCNLAVRLHHTPMKLGERSQWKMKLTLRDYCIKINRATFHLPSCLLRRVVLTLRLLHPIRWTDCLHLSHIKPVPLLRIPTTEDGKVIRLLCHPKTRWFGSIRNEKIIGYPRWLRNDVELELSQKDGPMGIHRDRAIAIFISIIILLIIYDGEMTSVKYWYRKKKV